MWSQYHIRPHNLKLEIHFLAIPAKILTTSFSPGHVFKSMPTFFPKKLNLCQRKLHYSLPHCPARVPSLAQLPRGCLATRKDPIKLHLQRGAGSTDSTVSYSEWKMQMFNGGGIKLAWTTQDTLHYIYTSNERALLLNTNSFKHKLSLYLSLHKGTSAYCYGY